jgi:hypothetical protein
MEIQSEIADLRHCYCNCSQSIAYDCRKSSPSSLAVLPISQGERSHVFDLSIYGKLNICNDVMAWKFFGFGVSTTHELIAVWSFDTDMSHLQRSKESPKITKGTVLAIFVSGTVCFRIKMEMTLNAVWLVRRRF